MSILSELYNGLGRSGLMEGLDRLDVNEVVELKEGADLVLLGETNEYGVYLTDEDEILSGNDPELEDYLGRWGGVAWVLYDGGLEKIRAGLELADVLVVSDNTTGNVFLSGHKDGYLKKWRISFLKTEYESEELAKYLMDLPDATVDFYQMENGSLKRW